MGGSVVGRDTVLEQVWQALVVPGSVLLEGPAGIGKTAVLRTLVDRARTSGMLVLGCAPTEAETALPLAAVADLLHPLADQVADLPGPQRAAAEAALLSGDRGAPVDERALAAAIRALLDDAASNPDRPVLLAIDDAPWLDPPSERALRFVLRRLSGRISVLVSCRTEEAGPGAAPLGLESTAAGPAEARLTRIVLAPLPVGPLHHVLSSRLGVALPRPMVARLARDSGGNPLLAIEMARAISRLARLPAPGDDLPVPGSMAELVGGTLAALPAAGLQAVRLASLLSTPTLADLSAAGVPSAALDPVEEAGLVGVTADCRVRFVHPVHAAAVRVSIPPGVRRGLHATLAGIGTDPDERARHLARCTVTPDAGIADELAAAGLRARGRGAPELAAEFYDRAADLTPEHAADERQGRRLTAVHCRYDSGDYSAAGAQAEALAAELTGDRRAEALLLRAAIAWSADDVPSAIDAATRALDSARADTPLVGRIHAHLSVFVDLPGPARHHAEAALRLLSDGAPTDRRLLPADPGEMMAQGDRSLLASVLMLVFFSEVRSGEPARHDLLDQALALEGPEPSWLAGTIPAIWWKGIDQHDRAVARLEWILERAVALGDEPFQHEAISHLAEAELLAGRYAAANRWAAEAQDLGEQLATGLAAETWLAGMLDAHQGHLAEAARAAEEGLRQAEETGEPWLRRINLQLAGFAALSAGRAADAAVAYSALAVAVDETGLVEPMGTRFEADWVEACIGAGDLDTAAVAQDRLAARHARLPRPWTALGLARGTVLLAGAAGRPTEAALDELAAARDGVAPDVIPFDRARCLLVAGVALRRARRKRLAQEALTAAAAEFDVLGARSYAERARAEAARIGGRPPASLDLTSTEDRVARLAATGGTNRSIADAMFISPRTVEANLVRIYRKLGIASRAELGAAMAARPARDTQ